MKMINTSEANKIVGGSIPKTCEVDFKIVGKDCFKVTTCADKNGQTVSENQDITPGFYCGLEEGSGS